MNLGHMRQVIGGKRYDTKTATLLASNEYWDGNNWERSGTNTWLFRTARGRYFFAHRTMWQGDVDRIEPCEEGEALEFFEAMAPHGTQEMSYEEAFPNAAIEEA